MGEYTVLKVGGTELADGPVLDQLVDVLTQMVQDASLVVVHGGGTEIATLQERLGLQPCFVDGLRVTDEASLWVAEMVLSGAVNKRLVARLVVRGVRAIGLSGVDCGLLRGVLLAHPKGDLGRVGEITQVGADMLRQMLDLGLVPIVSPISLGMDGRPLNVNADHAALAIASALSASEVIFLTNVPGVLVDGEVLEHLTADRAVELIDAGVINGGMIPKVRSALSAIACGVGAVRITDLAGLASSAHPRGTRIGR